MNWCEFPLLSKSTIFEQYNERSGKCFLEIKRKLLKYSICFYDEKNLKLKDGCNKLEAIRNRKLR